MSQQAATAIVGTSITHGTFSIERMYPQTPARVFKAHAVESIKRRWFAEGEGWTIDEYTLDFRIDGLEFSRFRFEGGPEIRLYSTFQDIVPDERIVFAYRMTVAGKPISVSLGTVTLRASGTGTRYLYTEQGVFFDDPSAPKHREEGSRELLDKLGRELGRQ